MTQHCLLPRHMDLRVAQRLVFQRTLRLKCTRKEDDPKQLSHSEPHLLKQPSQKRAASALSPLCRRGNRDPKELSNLPRVTQPVSGRAVIPTPAALPTTAPSHCLMEALPSTSCSFLCKDTMELGSLWEQWSSGTFSGSQKEQCGLSLHGDTLIPHSREGGQ